MVCRQGKILPIRRESVKEHSMTCNYSINEQDFSIKFRANCASDLRNAESLMIIKEKPDINGTEMATRLWFFFIVMFIWDSEQRFVSVLLSICFQALVHIDQSAKSLWSIFLINSFGVIE